MVGGAAPLSGDSVPARPPALNTLTAAIRRERLFPSLPVFLQQQCSIQLCRVTLHFLVGRTRTSF